MEHIPWGPRLSLVLVSTLFLLPTACSPGGGAGGEVSGGAPLPSPPIIRDSAGITIVENAEPQWAPGSEWQVGELLTSIGEAQGEPNYELFRVLDATRQSDGTVAVGNSSSGEIRFFTPDGIFVRKVGSTGGGPGEFRGANALRALRRTAGDTLVTWDIYGQLVSVFAPDGEFVRSFRMDGPAQQHFFQGIFEDGSMLMLVFERSWEGSAQNMPEGLIRQNISLHHYGLDHSLAYSLRDIPDSDSFQARWGPSGMMSTSAPFGRETSINVGGSRLYVATGDSDEIAVHSQSGELQLLIRRTMEPIEVTAEMIRRDRARRTEEQADEGGDPNVEPRVRRMIAELPYPAVLPPYGVTLVDSEGNLWMEEFQVLKGKPADWSVFDPQGVWLGRVTLPPGLEVFELGPDYILGRTKDELEVERIVVHELLKG